MEHPAKLATPDPLDVTGLEVQESVAVGPEGWEAMASCTGSPGTGAVV
jgi:hypothetical protein